MLANLRSQIGLTVTRISHGTGIAENAPRLLISVNSGCALRWFFRARAVKGNPSACREGLVFLFRQYVPTSGAVRKTRFRLLSEFTSNTSTFISDAVRDGFTSLLAAAFVLTSGVSWRWQNRLRSMPRNFCCSSRIQSQVCLPHSLSSFRLRPTRGLVQATNTTASWTTSTTLIYVKAIRAECLAEESIGAESTK